MLAPIDEELLDAGPRRPGPARLCVATRAVRPLSELIRFVGAPDGQVVPDIKRKLPGRGAWVTARRSTLARAVRRGALERALRGTASVPPDLAALTERLLERSVLDALAIARKAGQVVAGYHKVTAAVTSGTAIALIHAREAAADGVRKLAAANRPEAGSGGFVPIIGSFASADLDLALARVNVIHAALLSGHASEAVLARWRTLEQFCDDAGERGGEEANSSVDPGLGPNDRDQE